MEGITPNAAQRAKEMETMSEFLLGPHWGKSWALWKDSVGREVGESGSAPSGPVKPSPSVFEREEEIIGKKGD